MDLLECSTCREMKPPSSFYVRSDRPRGRKASCKACSAPSTKQVRQWRESNPEKAALGRKRERVQIYKLSVEEYDEMLERQDGVCAICLTDEPGGQGAWHIDHNHETGKVRGLLCTRCNLGLGYFRDNQASLKRAMAYLEVNDGPNN